MHMMKLKRLGCSLCLFAGLAFAAGATAQTTAAPKGGKESGGKDQLSARSVQVITGFALTTIPSEIKQPDGTILKIDRKNPEKITVPVEDARRIILVARNSAHAQICDMPELQAENYLALMRHEQAKKKWSQEQMLFINRLHLFTVMWLTGNVRFVEKQGNKQPEVLSEPDKKKKKTCSDKERENVKVNIEAFLKSVQKS